jgi:hypothetical protein
MQLLVRLACPMIAAPVQGDVDGIAKGLHWLMSVFRAGARGMKIISARPF